MEAKPQTDGEFLPDDWPLWDADKVEDYFKAGFPDVAKVLRKHHLLDL